jgi:protein TonB
MFKLTGILATSIYLFFVGLLFYYFNHHSEKKSIHFVKKNSERISVSIPAQNSKADKSNPKHIKKSLSKPKKKVVKKKVTKKKVVKKKATKKKVVKKKVVKKRVKKRTIEKSRREKKQKAKVSNLFDKIGDKKPSNRKDGKKRKKEDLDRGILNAYLANLEDILQGWSAQSEFAGESAKIWLKINRDGSFKFKLISPSNNQDFNSGLIQYLKQLQKIGFDPHKNSKPYELNIEFIAKE